MPVVFRLFITDIKILQAYRVENNPHEVNHFFYSFWINKKCGSIDDEN